MFKFEKQNIEDIILIKPDVYLDDRGFFIETYKKSEFFKNGINVEFCQDNYSKSSKRVLRGLHFQKDEYSQAKLVRCINGRIYDVVVDIRKNSPNFGKYVRVELSEENKWTLYIPEGFAHGFVVLSEGAEIMYKVSSEYNPKSEGTVIWNDKTLNIDWGIDFEPVLSPKDAQGKTLEEVLCGY